MNLPNQITERSPIDPKLAVGSSLPNPKGLLGILLVLYLVNEEKDYIDYSIIEGTGINLKPNLIILLKGFFSEVTNYDSTKIDGLKFSNPLLEMQIESLQVPLQLFWKIAKINILGTNSSSSERTGGIRYPKGIFFTSNMDILRNILSNEYDKITKVGKELLYSWSLNEETPLISIELEKKLIKTLLIFSEETLFKTWDNATEIFFQQEGIYNSLDARNIAVDIKGTKEIKGTLRNLKSSIKNNIHPYLKITSNKVQLKNLSLIDSFDFYQKRVSNYLDLNPKSIEIKTVEVEEETNLEIVRPINKIYFGAPGTGKSHKVKEFLKGKEDRIKRITFHPEYDYTSFVGGYKPITEKDENSGKEEIKYKFVSQIFINIYIDAWRNPEEDYFLVIEEINRGNCAEIFGDIFQLLDRDPEIGITPSSELAQFLNEELSSEGFDGFRNGEMKLPLNLNILATMNTSDQSLFPMDSAFKRRWDWEYIPIDYEPTYIDSNGEEKENKSSKYEIVFSETESYSWIDFIKKVNNNYIKINDNLGMDKCIGNYFIKAEENSILLEEFINKVIFYLWNDVFKDEDEHIFEENTFYEDFFPIQSKGKEKVLKIFEKIGLSKLEKEN